MSTVIENAQLIATQNHQAFLNTARRVGLGEAVSAEEIESVSTRAGKTVQEFQWMVDAFAHRAVIRRRIAELADAEREYRETQEKIAAANDELELHVAAHQRTTGPLQRRIHELRGEIAEFHNLPTELMANCPDRELQQRQQNIGRRRELNNARDMKLRELIDDANRALTQASSGEKSAAYDQVKKLEAELADVEAVEADLKRQADETIQAMIDF